MGVSVPITMIEATRTFKVVGPIINPLFFAHKKPPRTARPIKNATVEVAE
jgi:hypothetical protein